MKEEYQNAVGDFELYYKITKDIMERYDYQKTKANVEKLIADYKTAKFQYMISDEVLNKITMSYQLKEEQTGSSAIDLVGDNVGKRTDAENTIKYFDSIFELLLKMLSSQEKKYYSICLINNNSEQTASDIIGVSRTGLQSIKKNCIFKIALAFHIEVLN